MRIFIVIMVLMVGFSAVLFAQDLSVAGKDVADALQEEGVITADEVSIVSASVATLIKNGMVVSEAKKFIENELVQAKVQGLAGEELSAKLQQAVKDQKSTEHPAATVEHPKQAKPKDHPAH